MFEVNFDSIYGFIEDILSLFSLNNFKTKIKLPHFLPILNPIKSIRGLSASTNVSLINEILSEEDWML